MGIQTLNYTNEKGKQEQLAYIDRNSAYNMTAARERFCRLMAEGRLYAYQCYAEAFEHPCETEDERKACRDQSTFLNHDTRIVLRIQELKAPVVRKIRRKLNYDLQKALEQCEVAHDLAFEQGDPKTILKAIEMQSRLNKLLSEDINVTHRYGLLDDADTEVLLAMRKEIEVRKSKQKQMRQIEATKVETVSRDPL